jgi:SIR2-like domain
VSTGANLPDWEELLKRIGEVCLGQRNGRRIVSKLVEEQRFSLPSIAGMLRESCGSKQKFWDIVRDTLYEKFPFYPDGVKGKNRQAFLDYIRERNESQTLRAVAALCAVPDKRHRAQEVYARNTRVHAIINFNIDAVLRKYIGVRYPRHNPDKDIVRTVERASKSSHSRRINIYHMHGFLRFDTKANRPDKEAYDKLVFAEQEYFDFFNSPTSLFNYTFLYLLREHSCLFIGLSMKDDNIRRLLHYLRKERYQAYEEERDKKKKEIESKVLRHFAVLKRSESKATDKLMERSLRYLGVSALWVDEYEEIPVLLGEMYASRNDWSKVYEKSRLRTSGRA